MRGVQRVLASEVNAVTAQPVDLTLSSDAVHDVRVAIKRARAHWRLLRRVVGRAAFDDLDARLSELGHEWAPRRDADVLRSTLETVVRDAGGAPDLGARLEQHFSRSEDVNLQSANGETSPLRVLTSFQRLSETPEWRQARAASKKEQRERLARALKKTYRTGFHRLREALASPHEAVLLHDIRKQVKHQSSQLSLLSGKKSLKKRRKSLSLLASMLGDHHDLFQLQEGLSKTPDSVLSPEEQALLLGQVTSEQERLEEQALALARRLYRRKPGKFLHWLRKQTPLL